MAVLGIFLALVLYFCCLRFEKSIRGSQPGELVSLRVLTGGWFLLWSLSFWACLIFLWCTPPCNLEVPFWGSPLQLSSQSWRLSAVCARGWREMGIKNRLSNGPRCSRGASWLLNFHKAAEPVACLHRGFAECLSSAFTHTLACSIGVCTTGQAWGLSQTLPQGYLAGQVPADVNFQMAWHGCVTSEAPLPKAAALCSQFPHVWPSSLYHLTGSE